MTDNPLQTKAFKLKGRLCTLTVLCLMDTDMRRLSLQLAETVAQAPRLLANTPLVLDLSACHSDTLDLLQICHCVRAHGLFPIAVQSVDQSLINQAATLNLPVLHASSSHDKALPLLNDVPLTQGPEGVDGNKTKLIRTPVRSGQQVVNKGGDLVITASVSAGAELLSEGSIHVYGVLRGKALAGISGDKGARIFCQSLEAELVSIAGVYQMLEVLVSPQGPCQVHIVDDRIKIEPL